MADSEVAICNLALFNIGQSKQIDDLTEQSKAAAACALVYPQARDMLLAQFPWAFAKKRATLAQISETRTGWNGVWSLPADYIQAISLLVPGSAGLPVWPWPWPQTPPPLNVRTPLPGQKPPFQIEGSSSLSASVLLTDVSSPELHYIARVTATAAFPPLFTEALIWQVAAKLCMPMAVKPEYLKGALEAYKAAFQEAVAADMRSSGDEWEPATAFEQVRY